MIELGQTTTKLCEGQALDMEFEEKGKSAIAFGGPHYAPKFTKLTFGNRVLFLFYSGSL